MNLVIVESPSKAKTIEKYLGKGYKVIASKGHIIDLPKSELGIDVEKHYKPTYVVTNPASLENIKEHLAHAREVILAVDPDREGEAIGWHIAVKNKLINDKGDIISRTKKLKRIVFTEITKEALHDAISHPRDIDMNLVNAQQARRILDRLVGYKLSPLLWKKIVLGLSAGRVQSVAVRLVVDREKERNAFKAEEYWSLSVYTAEKNLGKAKIIVEKAQDEKTAEKITKEIKDLLEFKLVKVKGKNPKLEQENDCSAIVKQVKVQDWKIASLETKESRRAPKPPFTTSTLQQTAVNYLGFNASKTMKIAQKLYESGLITYMRTDSLHFSSQAIAALSKFIKNKIGAEFLPAKPRFYKVSSKLAQEAHEAIRPTDFARLPEEINLSGEQLSLYKLIWQRAVASQMAEAIINNSNLKVIVGDYTFQANGQVVVFPGFLKVYPDKVKENSLPKLSIGQQVFPQLYLSEQHFTEPPARFTEATLIKELEANGIGRPSTYAPIISTIQARRYVEKEGKYFKPTDTGIVVTRLLVNHFPEIVDKDFTAGMEENLDKIANGEVKWIDIIDNFYQGFSKELIKEEKKIKREDYVRLGPSKEKCPVCGKKMIYKLGRFGKFLSCSDFPKCKGMLAIQKDNQQTIDPEKLKKFYLDPPKTDDGRDFLLKSGRFGLFYAHPDYPKVKDARPTELKPEFFRKIYGNRPKGKDGKPMVLRKGKFGEYWAHPDYPAVKEVLKLDKKKVQERKKELGIL